MANTISLSSSTTPWLALSPPPPHVRCWTLLARPPRWSNRGASVLEAIARATEAEPGPRAERAAPGQVRSGVVQRAGRRLARHESWPRVQPGGFHPCTGGGRGCMHGGWRPPWTRFPRGGRGASARDSNPAGVRAEALPVSHGQPNDKGVLELT